MTGVPRNDIERLEQVISQLDRVDSITERIEDKDLRYAVQTRVNIVRVTVNSQIRARRGVPVTVIAAELPQGTRGWLLGDTVTLDGTVQGNPGPQDPASSGPNGG